MKQPKMNLTVVSAILGIASLVITLVAGKVERKQMENAMEEKFRKLSEKTK